MCINGVKTSKHGVKTVQIRVPTSINSDVSGVAWVAPTHNTNNNNSNNTHTLIEKGVGVTFTVGPLRLRLGLFYFCYGRLFSL